MLFGSPRACRGSPSPRKAPGWTSVISPEDMTRPWRATPSSSWPGRVLTFCTVQSRRDTAEVRGERSFRPGAEGCGDRSMSFPEGLTKLLVDDCVLKQQEVGQSRVLETEMKMLLYPVKEEDW